MSAYQPPKEILSKYAEVLVHCGLGHGTGIKPDEVVVVSHNQATAPLIPHLARSILAAGGHTLWDVEFEFPLEQDPEEVLKEYGNPEQLAFYPLEHREQMWQQAQHRITLKSVNDTTPSQLANTPAATRRRNTTADKTALLRHFRSQVWKSYTLAYYPTSDMARISGVTLEEFWQVIIDGCFLEEKDPVRQVRESQQQAAKLATMLRQLDINGLHILGENIDLSMDTVPCSQFVSSGGGNLPSYEVFGVPVASSVNGWFKSSFPSLFENELIGATTFCFESGVCVNTVGKNHCEALDHMLAESGMNLLGEVAFTDQRLSGINTALPGWPLFMENIGATGHLAFGSPIKKCLPNGDHPSANQSKLHLDFVYSGNFTVTATLQDGSKKVIWQDGQFTVI